jgi:hypothetical protein
LWVPRVSLQRVPEGRANGHKDEDEGAGRYDCLVGCDCTGTVGIDGDCTGTVGIDGDCTGTVGAYCECKGTVGTYCDCEGTVGTYCDCKGTVGTYCDTKRRGRAEYRVLFANDDVPIVANML